MFRTANPSSFKQLHFTRWVLGIVLICILMHFLVEDAVLLAAMASPLAARANLQRNAEASHLDDAAVFTDLSRQVQHTTLLRSFTWILEDQQQVNRPILTPPKI